MISVQKGRSQLISSLLPAWTSLLEKKMFWTSFKSRFIFPHEKTYIPKFIWINKDMEDAAVRWGNQVGGFPRTETGLSKEAALAPLCWEQMHQCNGDISSMIEKRKWPAGHSTQDITSLGMGFAWCREYRAGHNHLRPRLLQPVRSLAWVQRDAEEHIQGWAWLPHSELNL